MSRIRVSDGVEKRMTQYAWPRTAGVLWPATGDTIVVDAADQQDERLQLWTVSQSSGKVSHLTNDLNNYGLPPDLQHNSVSEFFIGHESAPSLIESTSGNELVILGNTNFAGGPLSAVGATAQNVCIGRGQNAHFVSAEKVSATQMRYTFSCG